MPSGPVSYLHYRKPALPIGPLAQDPGGWAPALQVDSLPAETLGKPKNTGVGSCSLLQGTLPKPPPRPITP